MGGIKFHPPNQLPESSLSEQQFQKWKTELETYLSMEDKFALFLPGETYSEWKPGEESEKRIREKKQILGPDGETLIEDPVLLAVRNKQLNACLNLVAKTVAEGHYATVMKYSTSLNWIYEEIRKDYDIQSKGIHFLNLIDLKYDETSMTPVGFYNQYRTVIINNLKKKNDVIKWKSQDPLDADEKISATFDDFILLQVLTLIDSRLPAHIRQAYAHKLGKEHTLMDFKSDIFVNLKQFKKDMAEKEQLTSLRAEAAQLSNFVARGRGGFQAFRGTGRGFRGGGGSFRGGGENFRGATGGRGARPPGQASSQFSDKPNIYCGACFHSYPGRKDIYNSHNRGDPSCPSKSFYNNNIDTEDMQQAEGDTSLWDTTTQEPSPDTIDYSLGQVSPYQQLPHLSKIVADRPHLGTIRPEPFQFLTIYINSKQTIVIHMMLDSGANVSFIRYNVAKMLGFKIKPCSQLSTLGDGEGLLGSCGEIDETFYRNGWTVRFRALVVPKLQSDIIGGLTFMKDNQVVQYKLIVTYRILDITVFY